MEDLDRRLQLARRPVQTLEQLLGEPLSAIVRDALIQRFRRLELIRRGKGISEQE